LELKSVAGGSFAVNGTPFEFCEPAFEFCELELLFWLLAATANVGTATTKMPNRAKDLSIVPPPRSLSQLRAQVTSIIEALSGNWQSTGAGMWQFPGSVAGMTR
jgi:hypothetical protein